MNTHLISVITPVGPGRGRYLEEAYESLVAQDLPDGMEWEWVLQEDGIEPTLGALARRDTRIRYGWNGVQQGAGGTRNLALGRARGEVFRNLDDDDRLSPGSLEAALRVLVAHDEVAYVVGPALDLVGGELVAVPEVLPPGRIEPMVLVDLWRAGGHVGAVHPATLCARRQVALALGGYMALAGSEDTGLLLALAAITYGWQLDIPVLEYRRHEAQTSVTSPTADPHARRQRNVTINARIEAIQAGGVVFEGPRE